MSANINVNPQLLEAIQKMLAGLEFGTVELVVHEAQVVQIERKEKVRLKPKSGGDFPIRPIRVD